MDGAGVGEAPGSSVGAGVGPGVGSGVGVGDGSEVGAMADGPGSGDADGSGIAVGVGAGVRVGSGEVLGSADADGSGDADGSTDGVGPGSGLSDEVAEGSPARTSGTIGVNARMVVVRNAIATRTAPAPGARCRLVVLIVIGRAVGVAFRGERCRHGTLNPYGTPGVGVGP